MYHACMHTRPPARLARRAAAPPPKVALLAPEDNQSSAKALEPTGRDGLLFTFTAEAPTGRDGLLFTFTAEAPTGRDGLLEVHGAQQVATVVHSSMRADGVLSSNSFSSRSASSFHTCRGTQWHSVALSGTQRHSEALIGTHRHSEALRGTRSVTSVAISGLALPHLTERLRIDPILR